MKLKQTLSIGFAAIALAGCTVNMLPGQPIDNSQQAYQPVQPAQPVQPDVQPAQPIQPAQPVPAPNNRHLKHELKHDQEQLACLHGFHNHLCPAVTPGPTPAPVAPVVTPKPADKKTKHELKYDQEQLACLHGFHNHLCPASSTSGNTQALK
ncbi:MAG: hypothetical protein K0S08_1155 [Gammaproteobacteria bacterium]|jgi:formylmethanofuran dehydrogenase subunit E-like metal-binding protein|nr:hypothetical protein [Gammaproteobacteria bacterium]